MTDRGLKIFPAEEANPLLDRWLRLGAMIGGAALLLFVLGGFLAGWLPFFQAYLFSYMFILELSLGPLLIALVHYLVGGRWGAVIRRPVEAAARTIWLLIPLFIPIVLGLGYLFPWAQPDVVAADYVLQHRTPYLNLPFFLVRAGIYFIVWVFLTVRLTGWSQRPEYILNPEQVSRFQRYAAFGLILVGLTMSFAAVDWLQSLDPHWYSSIYPLLIIVGQLLGGLALALLFTPTLAARTPLQRHITKNTYRDLGAFLLAFVLVWAYIAFSQYLIIWGANLPHEVTWYLDRSGQWSIVLLVIIFVQFVLPFLVLLSLAAKRSRRVLVTLSALILLMRLVDYFWQVKPTFSPGIISVHWLDLVAPIALGGLWLAFFAWNLRRTPLTLPAQPPLTEEEERALHRGHPPVRT
jgi:hypothetical protein